MTSSKSPLDQTNSPGIFGFEEKWLSRFFPFFFSLGPDLVIRSFGPSLQKSYPELATGLGLLECFELIQPGISSANVNRERLLEHSGDMLIFRSLKNSNLRIKGQAFFEEGEAGYMLFVGSPLITEIRQLKNLNLVANDFPHFDPTIDLALLLQTKKKSLEENRNLINILNKKIEEVQTINEQLEQSAKLVSIGELAAGVGHEINNPLAVVKGHSEIIKWALLRNKIDREKIQSSLDQQEEGIERIGRIVNGLRIYARSNRNENEAVDIGRLVEGTLSLVESIYNSERIEIVRSLPEDDIYVFGDLGKVQQVVMNLLANARDATDGLKVRRIVLTLKYSDERVWLTVEDNGCGIPEDIKSKIFNTFFTTKPVGKGTGMGLGISSQIVTSMDGKLSFESETGCGTTFLVDVPRYFPVAGISLNAGADHSEPVKELTLPVLSVLIVDDEEGILRILTGILEHYGIRNIVTAENGAIAYEKLKIQRFDLVISDLKMPVMDGPTFLKKVRELPGDLQPKLIAMTGGVSGGTKEAVSHLVTGFTDGFIYKPFDVKKLKEIIKGLFKN